MAANDWTSLANLKEHLKFEDTVAFRDALLTNLITRASKALDRYCGRESLKAADYTEYHDGEGTNVLLTEERPIISVTSLHDDPSRTFEDDTLVAAADRVTNAKEGMIRLLDDVIFTRGIQNLKLVYRAGYETIPEDAELACLILCSHIYNKAGTEGHTSLSLGGLSKSFDPKAWPDEVRAIVEPFRKRPV